VDDPKIEQPLDAVVRITTANICGSDLHPYEGAPARRGDDARPPEHGHGRGSRPGRRTRQGRRPPVGAVQPDLRDLPQLQPRLHVGAPARQPLRPARRRPRLPADGHVLGWPAANICAITDAGGPCTEASTIPARRSRTRSFDVLAAPTRAPTPRGTARAPLARTAMRGTLVG